MKKKRSTLTVKELRQIDRPYRGARIRVELKSRGKWSMSKSGLERFALRVAHDDWLSLDVRATTETRTQYRRGPIKCNCIMFSYYECMYLCVYACVCVLRCCEIHQQDPAFATVLQSDDADDWQTIRCLTFIGNETARISYKFGT